MDKNAVIENNCEDDIPLLEIRTSPEENIEKVTSEDPKDSVSSACDQPISEKASSEDKESPTNLSRSDELSIIVKPESKAEVIELTACSPSTTASSGTKHSDLPQTSSSDTQKTEHNSASNFVEQQKKLTISEEGAGLGTFPQPGVTQLGSGGPELRTKVDISHLPILSPAPLSESPVRKLELNDNPEAPVKQEDNDDDVTLTCDEKIGDSPELETKQQSRVPTVLSQMKVEPPVVDLLKPLHVDDSSNETKPDISFSLNEFGLVEVPRLIKGEIKKESVTASPRKDNIGRRIQDDNILSCEGCGCYGMAGEFVAANSCSAACNLTIIEKVREKQRREREALKQKQRRDAKKGTAGVPKTTHYNEEYPWHEENGFNWQKYLEWSNSKAAPSAFFKGDPFPPPHQFAKMMKLEAIDPQYPSCVCVVTVVEAEGPRLRLHFDGYSDSYDFWENANSENLFPVGWCMKNSQCLQPPKGNFLDYTLND